MFESVLNTPLDRSSQERRSIKKAIVKKVAILSPLLSGNCKHTNICKRRLNKNSMVLSKNLKWNLMHRLKVRPYLGLSTGRLPSNNEEKRILQTYWSLKVFFLEKTSIFINEVLLYFYRRIRNKCKKKVTNIDFILFD